MNIWSDEWWIMYFRMPWFLFLCLAEILRPEIAKSETNMRKAIPVEKRFAVAIFLLAHHCSYGAVSQLFGVRRATVCKIFVEVVLAMEKLLLKWTVFLRDHRKIMDAFIAMGYPQVVACLDGCHHNIIPPPIQQGDEFINRKNRYSVLQGTCDHRVFIDTIGWSGKNHDTRMLRNCFF